MCSLPAVGVRIGAGSAQFFTSVAMLAGRTGSCSCRVPGHFLDRLTVKGCRVIISVRQATSKQLTRMPTAVSAGRRGEESLLRN